MTNAMLRKQGWHTYWRNRGQMWLLFILMALLNTAWFMFQQYVLQTKTFSTVLSLLYSLTITPITVFGFRYILLRLIRKQKTGIPMVLDLYKSPFAPLKVYAAGVVTLLPSLLILPINLVNMSAVAGPSFSLLVAPIFIFVLFCWIQLRLFLFPYYVATEPDESIWNLVKLSFRKMKGQIRHLIWFGITVLFPVFIAYGILIYFFFSNLYEPDLLQTAFTVFLIVNAVLTVFLNPYIQLSFTAYANKLMKTDGNP